jgi:hypothetical protein
MATAPMSGRFPAPVAVLDGAYRASRPLATEATLHRPSFWFLWLLIPKARVAAPMAMLGTAACAEELESEL